MTIENLSSTKNVGPVHKPVNWGQTKSCQNKSVYINTNRAVNSNNKRITYNVSIIKDVDGFCFFN